MKPVKVKSVVVVEMMGDVPLLHSVHISRNPMWSASLHIKALKRKYPDRVYTRTRVDAFVAKGNELSDKLAVKDIGEVLNQAFDRAVKLYHPPI